MRKKTTAAPGKRPTIQDVAQRAAVHSSTVSRVMNERTAHMVTAEVAERVRRIARELGYRPDPVASGLRAGRSQTIGVLIPDLSNPVFPPILRGIEETLAAAGYIAIIANTDNDAKRASEALERLSARRVDGLIIATARRGDATLDVCEQLGLPVVLVNRTRDKARASAVINDDEAGIALAVEHLVALGHKRIAHLAGPAQLSTGASRREGFVAALARHSLPTGAPMIVEASRYEIDAGRDAATALLSKHKRITAIVSANDLLALGCYDALHARGLRCPADVSVIGFNDMPFADRFDPPLTTVRIPHRTMGVEAARLLLAEMGNAQAPKLEIKLKPELVVRSSTARSAR